MDPDRIGPHTLTAARFAAAAHAGNFWFEQIEEDHFTDPVILDFAREKVSIHADPALEAMRPERWAGAIELTTTAGVCHRHQVDIHKGEHENPLSDEELAAKFRRMAEPLPTAHREAAIAAVWALDELEDISELTRWLRP